MTDAYECDRCGELYSKPPAMRIATNKPDIGGIVSSRVEERDMTGVTQGVGGSLARNPATAGMKAVTTISHGDLCVDCADELRDYWQNEVSES